MSTLSRIEDIEKNFSIISNINIDMTFPIEFNNNSQVKTSADKSKQFGEVFTPLWLVDKMINQVDDEKFKKVMSTLDLCSGYGQFSIRLLRKYYSVQGEDFNIDEFFEKHWFSEIQPQSVLKLCFIFGCDINVAKGDSIYLGTLKEKYRGIYNLSDGKWKNVTSDYRIRHSKLIEGLKNKELTK